MDIEAPKVVSIDEVEILEAKETSVIGEKKVEMKEIPMEERDTAKAMTDFLEEQQEDFDPELVKGPINLATLSPIKKLKVASFAQAKARGGRF